MSSLTHCSHVFLLRPRPLVPSTTNPLQADTQSSTLVRSRCPNHLNLPRLITSATQLIPRIFAVLHMWPLQLLINNPVFYYNICCFSKKIQMNYFILRSLIFWGLKLYWPLTLKNHMRSYIYSSNESPYMTSYLTSIDTFFLSRTVFDIFDFEVFRVWPWPLTFEDHWRPKIFSPFKRSYMTSYLTSIDTFSLSRTVFEIFNFKVLRVWPWPLTFRGHLRSKIFQPFESPYMTSYLTSIEFFSLSRTVFEIFDFKVFRVWPWPLAFRGHQRSKIFSPFESPYMTFYLTSIVTFSLFRTVFEIFNFKVFRVWHWPVSFRSHLRSKIFSPFENS